MKTKLTIQGRRFHHVCTLQSTCRPHVTKTIKRHYVHIWIFLAETFGARKKSSGSFKKAQARRLAQKQPPPPPPPDSTWSLSDGILSSSHILSPRFSLKLRTIEGNSIGKAPSATNSRKRVQNPQKMYPNPDAML